MGYREWIDGARHVIGSGSETLLSGMCAKKPDRGRAGLVGVDNSHVMLWSVGNTII
jgi:hypothetical protein